MSTRNHLPEQNNILAISGGSDSIYLLHQLLGKGQKPILAHLNHKLRAEQSNGDEQFVRDLAKKNGLIVEIKKANVAAWAKQHKKSIEEAGRILRYEFFENIRQKHNAKAILTAHHLNDNLETVLMNQKRGCGIRGLIGMQKKQGNILRPLLNTSKEKILAHLHRHQIPYRIDESNSDQTYTRNQIRHETIPKMLKKNPNLLRDFQHERRQNLRRYKILKKETKQWLYNLSSRQKQGLRRLPKINSSDETVDARLARRDERAYQEYVSEKQRSQTGWMRSSDGEFIFGRRLNANSKSKRDNAAGGTVWGPRGPLPQPRLRGEEAQPRGEYGARTRESKFCIFLKWNGYKSDFMTNNFQKEKIMVKLSNHDFMKLSAERQKFLIQHLYEKTYGSTHELTSKKIDEIQKLILNNRTGKEKAFGKAWHVRTEYGNVILSLSKDDLTNKKTPGNELHVHFSYKILKHHAKSPQNLTSNSRLYLDADKIDPNTLRIRTWQPGDRFQPSGLKGTKKVQDFFVDNKIPKSLRSSIPILATEKDQIVAVGNRVDEYFKATFQNKSILVISLKENLKSKSR